MSERQHTNGWMNQSRRDGGTRAALPALAACLMLVAGTPVSLAQVQPAQPPAGPSPEELLGDDPGAFEPMMGRDEPLADEADVAGQDGTGAALPRNPLASPAAAGDGVTVNEHLIVDLHVHEEDLANVLQMLSIQSQKNIVTSRNVQAVVTANLYGVTFYEALDAILHVNGYGYIERGNFIYVYTLDELKEIEKAQRVRVWGIIKLNYLNSVDAAEFVKPLLSEGGQIKTNGKPADFQIPGDAPTGAEDYANDATMLVYDYPENLEEIKRVLAELDTRPSQVLIQATILQTALNEANAFGVDFSVLGDLEFLDFAGAPLDAVDRLLNGEPATFDGDAGGTLTSTPGRTDGPGTFKVGVVGDDVSVFLRMLDEVTDTTILSRPTLLALNRQPARVLVGRKVGYLNTTSTETATTQTVEFLDTGTQLYVRPFVSSEGMIRMELKPQVSEAVIRSITDAGGAAVTIPDEITNEITTNVMVRDGQTIVLGGLFRESTQSTRRQVPFVGDIPIIGAAFRGHEDEVQRSEIIFMITPTIVNDQVLIANGLRAQADVERVRAGAREGLLPFSRERQAGQLLIEAERAAAAGDTEKALNKVRRSLALYHQQPGAIALRERLLNAPTVWPQRSLLQTALQAEAEEMMGQLPADGGAAADQGEGFPEPEFGAADEAFDASAEFGSASEPSPTGDDPSGAFTGFDGESTDPASGEPEPEQVEFTEVIDELSAVMDGSEAPASTQPTGSSTGHASWSASAGAGDTVGGAFTNQLAADARTAKGQPSARTGAAEVASGVESGPSAPAEAIERRPMSPLRMAKMWTYFQGFSSLLPEGLSQPEGQVQLDMLAEVPEEAPADGN